MARCFRRACVDHLSRAHWPALGAANQRALFSALALSAPFGACPMDAMRVLTRFFRMRTIGEAFRLDVWLSKVKANRFSFALRTAQG